MSGLQSPVKKISDIWVEPLPGGKVINVTRVVKVDGITFMLGADKKLYCNQVMKNGFYLLGTYQWSEPLVKALKRLGYLTTKEMNTHLEAARRVTAQQHVRSSVKSLEAAMRDLGLTLSPDQRKKINAALKAAE